jgi:hypothetical protein
MNILTKIVECATICSRELMHYHGISTVEGLCYDMAVQRVGGCFYCIE